MSQVEMLEQTVKQLSPGERAAFRSWFIEYDAAEWDRQIEIDSETGKLDRLVQSAIEEHKAGKTKRILTT
jgi:predicted esterase